MPVTPPHPLALDAAAAASRIDELERELVQLLRFAMSTRKERDAWSALARARGEILADPLQLQASLPAQRRAAKAVRTLERMGINPVTSRPLKKKA